MRAGVLALVIALLGVLGLLSGLRLVHTTSLSSSTATVRRLRVAHTPLRNPASLGVPPPPPPVQGTGTCTATDGARRGITLHMGEENTENGYLGEIRLILRPEWTAPSADYAASVAAQSSPSQTSKVYRLEPGFLIQGSLTARGLPPNHDKKRAPKVMERGEVGWAGGGAGPDFFIYLGTGPASWLGNPHDGTIFAEVADEASMAVAANVSVLPVPFTPPGQMHMAKHPVKVRVEPWTPPASALDVTARAGAVTDALVPSSRPEASLGTSLGVLKVAGTSLDTQAVHCAAGCHSLARTELHGSVVVWGERHLQPTAAACCDACTAHAARAKSGEKPCNVWVHCGNAERCGKRTNQCWLKHAQDLWADTSLLVGTSDAWTAGTTEAAPADHPSGAGRTLPGPAGANVALVVDVDGAARLQIRLRLRLEGAPLAAALLREFASAVVAPAPLAPVGGGAGAADVAGGSCDEGPARLLDAVPPPAAYGSENVTDGLHAGSRWPRGTALVRGTLGGLLPRGHAPWHNATGAGPRAVEARPVAVRRGSIAWALPGGDGPAFFIALADMPHLGVSHTVWAEVVVDDLGKLDHLAADAAAGRARFPAPLAVAHV